MLLNPHVFKPYDLRVHIDSPNAVETIARGFVKILSETYCPQSPIVFLCIGTDRSTGDSLGPLVGNMLKEKGFSNTRVLGCLAEPVHAGNLQKVVEEIHDLYDEPYIIAVDASLGRSENIGTVKIAKGPLKPGAGVNKDLPPVGRFHITGIVNVGGFMEFMVLQNTRLFLVMRMAQTISEGITLGMKQFFA
ncbi:spore protease YyaC [Thermosediminibacter oceani]|uniref:Sporulation protein YyaC n=1 Tax=Thermosediminibacter oceani (strain ATCC BAA-1034 / DSM 16646 / JW/IW-1228P) TaxID=555079 RepID=D9S192_THEOJ|nr:spore protease YyaC [Thermosediminibacter oceani]ADL08971.1 sporulation protein YyaC [Thermosediminibacter oceani DSM 16646]